MGIIDIKAKKFFAGPGTSWIAEAVVRDEKGQELRVTVSYISEGEMYTVSKGSVVAFMNEETDEAAELLEEYEGYDKTKKSSYRKVFSSLRKVIDMMD